jgi:hypothetical protein
MQEGHKLGTAWVKQENHVKREKKTNGKIVTADKSLQSIWVFIILFSIGLKLFKM